MVIMPTQDNIVILLPEVKKDKTTKSGIVVAGGAQEDMPDTGIVQAVGPGRTLMNGMDKTPGITPGQKVVFNKFAGTKIQDGEKTFLIIKENDILAIIK